MAPIWRSGSSAFADAPPYSSAFTSTGSTLPVAADFGIADTRPASFEKNLPLPIPCCRRLKQLLP
jgi:hypothetical protein